MAILCHLGEEAALAASLVGAAAEAPEVRAAGVATCAAARAREAARAGALVAQTVVVVVSEQRGVRFDASRGKKTPNP